MTLCRHFSNTGKTGRFLCLCDKSFKTHQAVFLALYLINFIIRLFSSILITSLTSLSTQLHVLYLPPKHKTKTKRWDSKQSNNLKKNSKTTKTKHKVHGPSLECHCYSQWYFIEENDLPFPSRIRLQVASLLGMWLCAQFPFSVLFCSILVRAATASGSSYVHQSCVSGKAVFLEHSSPLILTIFLPLFLHRSRALRGEFDEDIHLEPNDPWSLTVHIAWWWVSALVSIYFKTQLLWWGMSDALFGYNIIKAEWCLDLLF